MIPKHPEAIEAVAVVLIHRDVSGRTSGILSAGVGIVKSSVVSKPGRKITPFSPHHIPRVGESAHKRKLACFKSAFFSGCGIA